MGRVQLAKLVGISYGELRKVLGGGVGEGRRDTTPQLLYNGAAKY